MSKRKPETPRPDIEYIQSLCEFVHSGRRSPRTTNQILDVASLNGFDKERFYSNEISLGAICNWLLDTLKQQAEIPTPATNETMEFVQQKRRTVVPRTPQHMVTAQGSALLIEPSPSSQRLVPWSESATLFQPDPRRGYPRAQAAPTQLGESSISNRSSRTNLPWPKSFMILRGAGKIDYLGRSYFTWDRLTDWQSCIDLGFSMVNCDFKTTSWFTFRAAENTPYLLTELNRFGNHSRVWDCPCVTIIFPVSFILGWYTVISYYDPDGYSADKLTRFVIDYLDKGFSDQERNIITTYYIKEHGPIPSTVEEYLRFYPSTMRLQEIWNISKDVKLTRRDVLEDFTFAGFDVMSTNSGEQYLTTKWA